MKADSVKTNVQADRQEIAGFAAWCVGSCHGDHDPRVETERQRVMSEAGAFSHWAAEHARFSRCRESGEPFIGNDGVLISEDGAMANTSPAIQEPALLPIKYEAARKAIAECAEVDELKTWSDKAAAIKVYAKQAKDKSLHMYALRIQARAQRRLGQMLKGVPAKKGGDRGNSATGGRPPVGETRSSLAESVGLSEHQRKTAIRVASVPERSFEEQVESDAPPSVARLAEQGKEPAPESSRDDTRERTKTRVRDALSEFARFCAEVDSREAAASFDAHEASALSQRVRALDSWLDGFITNLPEGAS